MNSRRVIRTSVIVPTKGRADMLAHLLDSLLEQTYDDFEVVVVNDGGDDAVARAVESARARGLPVHLVDTPGVGAVEARRIGVKQARGEILAFTDSDCVADANWLALGVRALDDGDADLAQGVTVPQREVGPLERTVAHSVDDGLFATCNIFYRRTSFDRAGGFDPEAWRRLGFRPDGHSKRLGFGEDTLLGWSVARRGRAADARGAIVRHEVVRPPVRELVARAWQAGAFPALVREVPELHGRLVFHRVVLGRPGERLLLYPAVVFALVGALPLAVAAAAAWAGLRFRRAGRSLKALPVQLVLDVVTSAALVLGSIRARRLVI